MNQSCYHLLALVCMCATICVFSIHGHTFHWPPFFLNIFLSLLLNSNSARVCEVVRSPPAVLLHLSLSEDVRRCISTHTYMTICMCVCVYVRVAERLTARLVYSLLPLFAKRLNPIRLVTVLLVRCVFAFPCACVCVCVFPILLFISSHALLELI